MIGIQKYFFPVPDHRTDRAVRRLVLADLLFLIYLSFMASDSRVIFTAILAGNAVGAIGGLLFAVPKQGSMVDASQSTSGPKIAITANTSLEEVSDWLTKTIIGAGLVSWRQILDQLDASGRIVGRAITDADPGVAQAGGVAVLVASAAIGALIGYLWFARHWPGELAGAQKSWHDILGASGQKQETKPVAPPEPILTPPPPVAVQSPFATGTAETTEDSESSGLGILRAENMAGNEGEGGADQIVVTSSTEAAIRLRDVARLRYAQMRSAPLYSHDWAKGMFGGSPSVTNEAYGKRTLSATVSALDSDWFEINLKIVADPRSETEAIFFLHNTFGQPTPTVGFDSNGIARLVFTAYGAFTVGVLLDDGTTELELDLAQLEGAPKAFVSH